MKDFPRIYCLTLQGSRRHIAMKEKLDALGLPYEFYYGNRPEPGEIDWNFIRDSTVISDLYNNILCGVAGCKYGHMHMMEKALQDTGEFFIFCQDDLVFNPGFKERVEDIVSDRYTSRDNIFNLGATEAWYWFAGHDVDMSAETVKAPVHGGDQCYLVDRKGARDWIESLKTYHMESDQSTNRYWKDIGQNVTTFTWEHGLVSRDERFHHNSTIANGPAYDS